MRLKNYFDENESFSFCSCAVEELGKKKKCCKKYKKKGKYCGSCPTK